MARNGQPISQHPHPKYNGNCKFKTNPKVYPVKKSWSYYLCAALDIVACGASENSTPEVGNCNLSPHSRFSEILFVLLSIDLSKFKMYFYIKVKNSSDIFSLKCKRWTYFFNERESNENYPNVVQWDKIKLKQDWAIFQETSPEGLRPLKAYGR